MRHTLSTTPETPFEFENARPGPLTPRGFSLQTVIHLVLWSCTAGFLLGLGLAVSMLDR